MNSQIWKSIIFSKNNANENPVQPPGATPTMTNFRIESGQPSRVYFDTLNGEPVGLSTVGFIVSNNTITGVDTSAKYFSLGSAYSYWDNGTIRLENGNDVVYDFTLEDITNNIPAPTPTRLRYVSVSGSGSGDGSSQSNEWTFQEALSNGIAGDKVYLRKGNYGGGQFDVTTSGTEANPITFEGYGTTPGDNPSLTMDGEITFDANVMPLFGGGGAGEAGRIINGSSKNYIIWRNLQFQEKQILMEFGGTSGHIKIDNCYYRWASIGPYFSGAYAQNVKCRLINSYISNCQSLMFRTYGSHTLIKDNYLYQGNSGGVAFSDYYISIYGGVTGAGNNVIVGNHVEVDATSSGGSRHGISIKASDKPSSYNLIEGNTILGQKPGIEIRHLTIDNNVAKNNVIDGNGVSDTTGIEFRGGAANNITEYNTISNVSNGIRYGNGETSTSDPSSTNNVVRNSTFENLGSCIQTAYRADKTSALSQYNKIQNCTFINATQMFELTDNIPMDDTNLIENSIFDDVGNLYNVTTYNNGAIPYAFTFSYSDIWACGARGDNSSPGSPSASDNWITPTGTGVFEVAPQLDVDLQPQATFTDIDVPRITGVNYDKEGNERQDPTTVGSVLSAEEIPSEPPSIIPDYYVALSGDNSDGLTEPTAYNSVTTLLASETLVAGDIVGLKGGDEFFENVTINASGAVDNPITFTSYGTGQAVIKGTENITGWTNTSGNIWEADVTGKTVYQVISNLASLRLAAHPDYVGDYAQFANKLQADSGNGSNQIVDSDLITLGDIDLVGATLLLFENHSQMIPLEISAYDYTTGTITITGTNSNMLAGRYFVVINSFDLLSEEGEWYYSSTEDKLYIYSSGSPTNIEATTSNTTLFNITNSDYIDVNNLTFKGTGQHGIVSDYSNYINIDNINVFYANTVGIINRHANYCTITNNYVKGSWHLGLNARSDYGLIEGNTIEECGLLRDYNTTVHAWTSSEDLARPYSYGIEQSGTATIIRRNILRTIGYLGVRIYGDNCTFDLNFIENFCTMLHDGGGLYTWNSQGIGYAGTNAENLLVDRNTIVQTDMTPSSGWYDYPIYCDDSSHDITITNNTLSGGSSGIFLHNNKDVVVTGNNIYGSAIQGIAIQEDGTGQGYGTAIDNLVTYNNILMDNEYAGAIKIKTALSGGIPLYGSSDYNTYFNLATSKHHVRYEYSGYGEYLGLAEFQAVEPTQDQNSTSNESVSVTDTDFLYNETDQVVVKTIIGQWSDLRNNQFDGSVTLQPYSSVILIQPPLPIVE